MLRHNCKLYFRLIFYHTCLESSSRAKHPVARNDSRATSENRVEISQLGRARTCQIRLTPLAGSSTTRTEMRNYWEDPEATASSPIPIAPIHPSKRSRRSRPPRETGERHWFRRTLQSSPSRCDRSIDSDGQHLSMIRRKLFSRVIKKHGARRVDRSRSCIPFGCNTYRKRVCVGERARWLYRKRIYYGGVWGRNTVLSKFRCKWELPWKALCFDHPTSFLWYNSQ